MPCHLTRRSSLLLGTACLVGMTRRAARAARAGDEPRPIVTDGARFAAPAGWIVAPPDRPKTRGLFLSPDSTAREMQAMIKVDIGKPLAPDLPTSAAQMAQLWGGRVLDEPTTLDGVAARRVRADRPGTALRPVEGVVAIRDGRLYLIMGGAVPGRDVAGEVEEVRRGWRWVP